MNGWSSDSDAPDWMLGAALFLVVCFLIVIGASIVFHLLGWNTGL